MMDVLSKIIIFEFKDNIIPKAKVVAMNFICKMTYGYGTPTV